MYHRQGGHDSPRGEENHGRRSTEQELLGEIATVGPFSMAIHEQQVGQSSADGQAAEGSGIAATDDHHGAELH